MKKYLLIVIFLLIIFNSFSQSVAINTDGTTAHSSAILDIKSTSKGLLTPRMTSTERTAIASPAQGLFVFDLTTNSFWYYNGSVWNDLAQQASLSSVVWRLNGNGGTNPSTDFIGTTDNQPLLFRLNNSFAGKLDHINSNYSLGIGALQANTTGIHNIAIGDSALATSSNGWENTAIGYLALRNVTASNNTAVGSYAMYSNTDGYLNCAFGENALYFNKNGAYNNALGFEALLHNTSGSENNVLGAQALANNKTGSRNVAVGVSAMASNSDGSYNIAVGFRAMDDLQQTGDNNIAIGSAALANFATLSGSGSDNIAIGNSTGVRNNGTNAIAIGNTAVASSNEIVIGNDSHTAFFGRGIYNATTASASNVSVNSLGQLMRVTSSARYKEDIADLEINTADIYKLRPVSYTSKTDMGRHFGLIAEEVALTVPQLAEYAREKDVIKGSTSEKLIPDAVQYPLLSVLLLKEVQKHQNTISSQQKTIEEQQIITKKQQEQIDQLKMENTDLKKQLLSLQQQIDELKK